MLHCDLNSDNILVNCNEKFKNATKNNTFFSFQNPYFKIGGFGTSIRLDTDIT